MEPCGPNYALEDIVAWVKNFIIAMTNFQYIGVTLGGQVTEGWNVKLYLYVKAVWYDEGPEMCK